jgi:hypothetical protein
MNATPQSFPNLKSLYWCDFPIKRAANTMGFCLFAAAGIKWATQPVASVVQVENSPFEVWVAESGPTVALVVAALALIFLLRRYLWIRKVLSWGVAIKGTVEDVDIYAREASHSSNTPAFERATIRTYHAIIRYRWGGVDKTVRLKLPSSPGTFGISKDADVELLALESAPAKPLIRQVYLGRM